MKKDLKCPDCGAPMRLRDGKYGKFYGCIKFPRCRGSHGAHNATGKPMGVPGNAEVRSVRTRAHDAFDPIWKGVPGSKKQRPLVSRDSAYRWLARTLGLNYDKCHIGNFEEDMCQRVINVSLRYRFDHWFPAKKTVGRHTRLEHMEELQEQMAEER